MKMNLVDKLYNPFISKNDSTDRVMADVVIALIPSIIFAWVAYGFTSVMVVLVSVGSALFSEFLFNIIFSRNNRSLGDGSSIVTGILLAFTVGAFIPLPVVAAGSALAVIFGKMLWGGLGRNRFNPALTGREFMVILFPAVMNSPEIWQNQDFINYKGIELFGNSFFDSLLYKPVGAIGEYSPLFLIIGGLFLLWRRRISWHIPFAMLIAFTVMLFIFRDQNIGFTLGGLLLGAIYMATDMPTSSSTNAGKIYFGVMIGIVAVICLIFGATRGYFSYSILILNAFVVPINWIFRPRTWGKKYEIGKRLWQAVLLTATVIIVTFGVLWLDNSGKLIYLVIIYSVYSLFRFLFSTGNIPWGKIIKR